jgi:hypothetical protein
MLSADVEGLERVPISTFNYALPIPKDFNFVFKSAPTSPRRSSHGQARSPRRSFDNGTREAGTLAKDSLLGDFGLPSINKALQTKPAPTPGHSREDEKRLDEELSVELNVFHNDEMSRCMGLINKYKELGLGKDIELPRVCSIIILIGLLLTIC